MAIASPNSHFDAIEFIFQRFKEEIEVADRLWTLTTYRDCFVGSEAVSLLSQQNNISREEAIELGQRFMDDGLFSHVCEERSFQDKDTYYRFSGASGRRSDSFDVSTFTKPLQWMWQRDPNTIKEDLIEACKIGHLSRVKKLLHGNQDHISPETTLTPHGWTAFHFAANHGSTEILAFLCNEMNGDVNVATATLVGHGDDCTSLMVTAMNGDLSTTRFLCEEMNADIAITNDSGRTALDIARAKKNDELCRYLMNECDVDDDPEAEHLGRTNMIGEFEIRQTSYASEITESDDVVESFQPIVTNSTAGEDAMPQIVSAQEFFESEEKDEGTDILVSADFETNSNDGEDFFVERLQAIIDEQAEEIEKLRSDLSQERLEKNILKLKVMELTTQLKRLSAIENDEKNRSEIVSRDRQEKVMSTRPLPTIHRSGSVTRIV